MWGIWRQPLQQRLGFQCGPAAIPIRGPLLALNDLALQKGVPRGVRLTRSEIAEISCQMITDAATNKRPCQTGFYRILEAMLILIKMGPGRADKPEVLAKPPPRPRRQRRSDAAAPHPAGLEFTGMCGRSEGGGGPVRPCGRGDESLRRS